MTQVLPGAVPESSLRAEWVPHKVVLGSVPGAPRALGFKDGGRDKHAANGPEGLAYLAASFLSECDKCVSLPH